MTTKVVKGSMWTLAGQIVPLLATLITTPFVIRLLGSESYGVLLLVGLIPNYFTFADFGMGMASTKFGSEAYGRGDREGEAAVVRTAALIALICSSVVALPMIIFAGPIVVALNVPEHLLPDATLALRLTAGSFIAANLSNVFNTPQLTRLRMDLNAVINATGRVVLAVGTVTVLFLGGGIVGAAAFMFAQSMLGLLITIIASRRLLNELIGSSLLPAMIRPMVVFGAGLTVSVIAGLLLVNSEKLILPKLLSVQALAYYSVAFTFANMATMFSWAMVQSLIPAFSQLLAADRQNEFKSLFARTIRLSIIWLMPMSAVLLVVASPFFTLWAGSDFGRESTGPFYVLLIGLLFNVISYVPYSSLVASGRTGVIAKLNWFELIPYLAIVVFLISNFGIIGAALAWTIRVTFDSFVLLALARSRTGAYIDLKQYIKPIIFGALFLSPATAAVLFFDDLWLVAVILLVPALIVYAFWIWKKVIDTEERMWIFAKLKSL